MSNDELLRAAEALEAEAERLDGSPQPAAPPPEENESVLKDARKHLDALREIAGESASEA